MGTTLRALLIEDSEFDAQMLVALLRRGGYKLLSRRVETREEMEKALEEEEWDIVLADYHLPTFSAPEALGTLQSRGQDLPFIVVSGAIGEKTAVEIMKAGAHDYLMKGSLARLVPAVERELREAANRRTKRRAVEALRESEHRYRLLWETATDAILMIDPLGRIQFASPAVRKIFGYEERELVGREVAMLEDDEPGGLWTVLKARRLAGGTLVETHGRRKDGRLIHLEVAFSDMELDGHASYVAFVRDVTQRRRVEEELRDTREQFRVAADIQQHLFPGSAPEIAGFDIAGASLPAEATGGDYFDYLAMPKGKYGLVIGDVTGHGIGPALLMAETRAYLRILARNRDNIGQILTRANGVLAEDVGYERFVTLLMIQLQAGRRGLVFGNAGHPPGYVLRANGTLAERLCRTGIPLGLRPSSVYETGRYVPLEVGDVVVLLTDGFEETSSATEEMFGVERTLEVIRSQRQASAAVILQTLYETVREFAGDVPQADDLTGIVVKVIS